VRFTQEGKKELLKKCSRKTQILATQKWVATHLLKNNMWRDITEERKIKLLSKILLHLKNNSFVCFVRNIILYKLFSQIDSITQNISQHSWNFLRRYFLLLHRQWIHVFFVNKRPKFLCYNILSNSNNTWGWPQYVTWTFFWFLKHTL